MENRINHINHSGISRKPFPILSFIYPVAFGSFLIAMAYYAYEHISLALKGSGFTDMNYFLAAGYKVFGIDGLFYVIFSLGIVFYLFAVRVVLRFFKEMI